MIKNLWITNPSNDQLHLSLSTSGEDEGLTIFNMTGLGPPKATISGLGGPNFDGVGPTSVNVDARHLVITLAISQGPISEEIAKQKIYTYFPIKQEIRLRIQTDVKDVYTMALVESVEFNQFAKIENAVISLYCPNPWFWNIAEENTRFWLNSSQNIPHSGEVSTGIHITITLGGTTSTITITNDNGNQSMVISLTPVGGGTPGDRIYLNTHVGQKSILFKPANTTITQNLITGVGLDQDWIQIHPGDNLFEISGTITPHSDMPNVFDLDAYWPLNETNYGDALALKGDMDFTPYGSIDIGHVYERLVYDYARFFTWGQGQYFKLTTPYSVLFPTGDFTFAFWAKLYGHNNYNTVIETPDDGDGGYHIRFNISGNLEFGLTSGGSTVWKELTVVSPTNWNFYCVWYDFSAETMYLRQNSLTPVSQTNAPGSWSYTSDVYIGGLSGGHSFNGRLQSIILYGAALTENERDFLYNTTIGEYGRTYAEVTGEIEAYIRSRPLFQGV